MWRPPVACVAFQRAAWLLAAAMGLGGLGTAAADAGVTPGSVVVLRGTAHVWIADDDAVLHWVGDTRALSARRADWDTRREVGLAELVGMPRGGPWLSSGLLKLGDPVYLVKWETADVLPTLAHVNSIRDLEVFGIDGSNWGSFVYERELWERRFGIAVDRLPRTQLVPAVAMPSIVAQEAPVPAASAILASSPLPSGGGAAGVGGVASPPASLPLPAEAMSDKYRINRTPVVRADGDLPIGIGEGWTEGIALDPRDHRFEVPYSSHVLAEWTIASGSRPSYARVVAVNLDYNKDVASIPALARKVFETYCRGASGCGGDNSPTGVTTVGGMPALRYAKRTRVEYWTRAPGGGGDELVQREWLSVHVLFLRGEWGYEIRLFSEDPSSFRARSDDFLAAIAKAAFRQR